MYLHHYNFYDINIVQHHLEKLKREVGTVQIFSLMDALFAHEKFRQFTIKRYTWFNIFIYIFDNTKTFLKPLWVSDSLLLLSKKGCKPVINYGREHFAETT